MDALFAKNNRARVFALSALALWTGGCSTVQPGLQTSSELPPAPEIASGLRTEAPSGVAVRSKTRTLSPRFAAA